MDNDELRTWLEGLKAGDAVAECYPGIGAVPMKTTVDRRTPSGRIVIAGRQYDHVDGRERGGRHYIRPWRQSDDDEREQRITASRLMDIRWRDVPLETLRRVLAALEGK